MKLSRKSVGLAVRAAREAANLTSADLAGQTAMTPSSLSRTENGLRALEFHEAVAVAKCLGIEVEDLRTLAETFERDELPRKLEAKQRDLNNLQRLAVKAAIELSRG
jgi:transcriptional regulator with XRE-family HTH domain